MKKIIAIALALVMCLGIMSMVAFAAEDKMTINVVVPSDWADCNVYGWNDGGAVLGDWPGTKVTGNSFQLPSGVTGLVLSTGTGSPQTVDITDLTFTAGKKATITVGEKSGDKHTYTISYDNGGTTEPTTTKPTTTQPTTTKPTTTQPTTTAPAGKRNLTIKVPSAWKEVYIYTWEPETLGGWPGAKLTKDTDGSYKTTIDNSIVNMVISREELADTTRPQTGDIQLQNNGKAVTITVKDDCSYTVAYDGVTVETQTGKPAAEDPDSTKHPLSAYRVVGNAAWMGNWDAASDLGRMHDMGNGVYRKNFDNVEPGSYELKITKDGKWDVSYGDNGNNYTFTVVEKGKITVDFKLEGDTGVIEVYGKGITPLGDISMLSVVVLMALASVTAIVLVVNKKKFI